MPADLAPVYLDDTRVTLQGDPRPKVAKILQAGGRPPDATVRLDARTGPGRPIGADEVIDRTGTPSRAIHLRTGKAAGDEGLSVGTDQGAPGAQPGHVQVPGDILRGTEGPSTARPSPPSPSGNPPAAQRFAESQSFGDPVHKAGGIRTREGGSQEGARTPGPAAFTTASRKSLQRSTEEE
jgi:hypothetical protein